MKSYERVVALSPDSWRGLLNYSVALVGLGREAEAKQALRRAFRLSGEFLYRCQSNNIVSDESNTGS